MRVVAEIEKSVELLRQRIGWETVEHRLEEYNAMSEDPDLWNDPDKAQKLMRERQQLVDAHDRVKTIAQELADQQELIELGEMEEDADVVSEAEEALEALRDRAAQAEIAWPMAQITRPAIQRRRPRPIAHASVPLTMASARGAPASRMGSVSAR